jgi:hypothetical protein
MSTNTHRNVPWVIEVGAALVVIGVSLNVLVTQTLGSFDAASVILALYVALWAYVLGTIALLALPVWLLLTRKSSLHEPTYETTIAKPQICKA